MAEPTMRQATVEDIDVIARIVKGSRGALAHDRPPTAAELKGFIFGDPDYDPAANMLVFEGEQPVGLASVILEKMRLTLGKNDGIIEFELLPERRGHGVEEMMIVWGLSYLKGKDIGTARLRIEMDNRWKLDLAASGGFKEAYRILDLTRRGTDQVPEQRGAADVVLERKMIKDFDDGQILRLNGLLNEAFKDHFNSVPTPPERLLNMRDVFEDVFMVTTASVGGAPVGACLTEESVGFNRERGKKSGWIVLLGVVPSHRRGGIGRLLLADGMGWLLERGMDTLNISLIATNEKALGLYRSLGFEEFGGAIWHTKPVAPLCSQS